MKTNRLTAAKIDEIKAIKSNKIRQPVNTKRQIDTSVRLENLTPEQVVILVIFRIEQVREGNEINNINQSVPQEEI